MGWVHDKAARERIGAARVRLTVADGAELHQPFQIMMGFQISEGAGLGTDHQGVGHGAGTSVGYAAEEGAAGNTRSGEEGVISLDEALDGEDFIEVSAFLDHDIAFGLGLRVETAEDLAAEALDGTGRTRYHDQGRH